MLPELNNYLWDRIIFEFDYFNGRLFEALLDSSAIWMSLIDNGSSPLFFGDNLINWNGLTSFVFKSLFFLLYKTSKLNLKYVSKSVGSLCLKEL